MPALEQAGWDIITQIRKEFPLTKELKDESLLSWLIRLMTNDFKPFGSAITKIQRRHANKSYEIYLSLYQAVTGTEEKSNIYKQFSPGFSI